MKKAKIYTLALMALLLVGLLGAAIIPNIKAYGEQIPTAYDFSATASFSSLSAVQPSGTASVSAYGFSFRASTSGYLATIVLKMMLWNGSTPATNPNCVYEMKVVSGSAYNSWNISDVKATSTNTLNSASLSNQYPTRAWKDVTFNFGSNVQITALNYYFAYIYVVSGTPSDNGYAALMSDSVGNPEYCAMYYNGAWQSASSQDTNFLVTVDSSGPPAPSLAYSYTISPAVSYNFNAWGTSAVTEQLRNYTYTGTVLNNSVAAGSGTYSVYKTSVFVGSQAGISITNASNALTAGSVTLNLTGTVTDGQFTFYFKSSFIAGSVLTYQGFRVNGTINGMAFTSDLVIAAAEPDLYFIGTMSGGHFDGSMAIATAPTAVYLQQQATYTYTGTCYQGNTISGTGNFTISTTGLYSDDTAFSINSFNAIANGTVTNGQFTFTLASRQGAAAIYEGYRVYVILDNGRNYTVTYNFVWQVNVWSATATPTLLVNGGGLTDTTGLNTSMLTIINFMILFLLIGAPALLLGVKIGLPGFIGGAAIGIGLGIIAGLIPFWFIFITGSGVVLAFLAWNRNKAAGQ